MDVDALFEIFFGARNQTPTVMLGAGRVVDQTATVRGETKDGYSSASGAFGSNAGPFTSVCSSQ